jgi:hypothetical protein
MKNQNSVKKFIKNFPIILATTKYYYKILSTSYYNVHAKILSRVSLTKIGHICPINLWKIVSESRNFDDGIIEFIFKTILYFIIISK